MHFPMQPSSATERQGHDAVSTKAWREPGVRSFLWLLASKVASVTQGHEPVSGGVVPAVAR